MYIVCTCISITSAALCTFLSTEIGWAIPVCEHISQELVKASLHKRNLLWNQLQRIFTLLKIYWKIHVLENEIAFFWLPPNTLNPETVGAPSKSERGYDINMQNFLLYFHTIYLMHSQLPWVYKEPRKSALIWSHFCLFHIHLDPSAFWVYFLSDSSSI